MGNPGGRLGSKGYQKFLTSRHFLDQGCCKKWTWGIKSLALRGIKRCSNTIQMCLLAPAGSFQPLEGLNGVQTAVGEVTNLPHTEPVLLLNYTVLWVWVQSFGRFFSSSPHPGVMCERERF